MKLCVPLPAKICHGKQTIASVGVENVSGLKHTHMVGAGLAYSIQKSPLDAIGTTTVTFSGVNAGSEIRVYLPDGTELAGVESCAANQQLTWNVYAPGVNSVVTIRIVNVAYKIKEFDYTPTVGAQTLPVQQEADKWYKNPL